MNKSTDSISTKEFLEVLFGKYLSQSKGYIETREFRKDRNGPIQCFHKTIDELLSYQPQGDLYFGVCPRRIKSGKEEYIYNITSLWVDLDSDTGFTKEQGLSRLQGFKLKSSIVVDSGNGLHAYWLLKTPELVNPDTKGILRGLARILGADHCFDLPRILRVPGTKNYKDPNNPKKVKIIVFEPELRYSFNEFIQFKVDVEDIPQNKIVFSGQVKDTDVNDLKITDEIKALIAGGKQDGDGYPSRSELDFRIVSELVKAGHSDDDIRAVYEKYPIGAKHRSQRNGYL